MRVTYIHQHYRHPRMPGGTRSHEFASFLARRGHNVTVVASWQGATPRPASVEVIDGYRVFWVPVRYSNSMGFIRRLLAFFKFALLATWRASLVQTDVVFASSTPLTIVIPAAVSSYIRKVPWVLEVRDLWPSVPIAMGTIKDPITRWVARCLEQFGYRSAAHVVALSPGMRHGILRAGVPPEKVTVVPNFADLARFAPENNDPGRFLRLHPRFRDKVMVLYAGTIGRVNGVTYLVDIALEAAKSRSSVVFCVLGDGGCRKNLIARADRLGVLDKNFYVLDPVPKRDVPSAFACSRLCISLVIDIPELWENSANKFFDALAAGRPIAINHLGWQADLLRASGAGIVLPPDDAGAAWRAIDGLLGNPDAAAECGRRARALAGWMFDRDSLLNSLERVLLGVCSGSAGNTRVGSI